MANNLQYVHLISVSKGSVTDAEKLRVVREFENLGCAVVFLEFSATSGIQPTMHVVVRSDPDGK